MNNEIEFNEKQQRLLEFVKAQHGSQIRKYTGEPYYNHLISVARIVNQFSNKNYEIEIALCHDLFEDTSCTKIDLLIQLVDLGYGIQDSHYIVERVADLTDVYISENYPQYNRRTRKEMEAQRLATIHEVSQTVKYADLIDNTSSIVSHDKGFSIVYLREKEEILALMNKGNQELYSLCLEAIKEAKKTLEI